MMPLLGQNGQVEPMLAQARASLPRGSAWSYEFKWDGMRALLDLRDGRIRITTRNGNDVTVAYPELQVLTGLRDDAVIDGEIVALDGTVPSFERMQQRMHLRDKHQIAEVARDVPVHLIAFDLLRLDGTDLTGLPLSERRLLLGELAKIDEGAPRSWSVSPVFDDADSTLQVAKDQGLEGVVAKLNTSRYIPGQRGSNWVKVKLSKHAEFLVIGWEAAADNPSRLTSLVLGYYEADPSDSGVALRLAGKVSSGLDDALTRRLQGSLVRAKGPHDLGLHSVARIVTWVEPTIIVEVSYTEWSQDGRLRHPVLMGLRTDKNPQDVTREVTYGK
jgi:bifunctional non-homologous end joining protein LigD